ncbi:MAG: helix-turn-helix transcriptional regulator [Betaproteobacteria bacterium]|nr:helix-turn-helix transcriptional regulator [Betaproteobacteria bacterium]
MKNTALLAHIRQLCCLGLGGRAIMPALLKAARELVPSDSAEFFWVDARGEMTNHYAERTLPADAMQFYFRQPDAAAEHPLFASFRTRAAQPDPVTTLSVTDTFRRSDHYRTVMQHFGAEHALYCIVRERDRPLGQLSLYRGGKRAPFGGGDRTAIAAIAGYIAHGLDESFGAGKHAAADETWRDTDHQAMLTLERDGTLRHCSSAARRLLLYVTLDSVNRGTVAQQEAAITGLMRELAAQLTAVFGERDDVAVPPPSLHVTNRWGRFVLRAHWLTDDVHDTGALIGVQIRRQEPTVLRLSQAMQGLGLSPQQREVGLMLAQGKSNPEIAGALGVTLNTANYHVKQLFAKLNTHERTEVAPKLLGMCDALMHARASQQPGVR